MGLDCCNAEQSFFIVTVSCYILAVALMWRSALLKPFKLWTVCLHEFSHAIAAWATCNKVTGIEINAMEGGLTHWSGRQDRMRCSQHAVLPAGYLGSTLWGALTILSCSSVAWAEAMGCILLSVLGICALYAAFGKTEQERTPLLAVCTGFGLALGLATFLAIGSSGNGWDLVLYALLLFLGTLNVVFGIIDIFDDTLKRTDARSDAYRFAQLHQIFRRVFCRSLWHYRLQCLENALPTFSFCEGQSHASVSSASLCSFGTDIACRAHHAEHNGLCTVCRIGQSVSGLCGSCWRSLRSLSPSSYI
uniref:Uncharacterized protein n=1 Tax=Calcidiscus leptoporus TaxID=127549 RepID=A0A7S0P410_9EUKA|mmetsp:Transcript_56552/g.129883  ORF Transcript_56552/g.129883 Transcript_56552/m.129883 type:complete len:305 (+) Transcript_56552:54-968(+)